MLRGERPGAPRARPLGGGLERRPATHPAGAATRGTKVSTCLSRASRMSTLGAIWSHLTVLSSHSFRMPPQPGRSLSSGRRPHRSPSCSAPRMIQLQVLREVRALPDGVRFPVGDSGGDLFTFQSQSAAPPCARVWHRGRFYRSGVAAFGGGCFFQNPASLGPGRRWHAVFVVATLLKLESLWRRCAHKVMRPLPPSVLGFVPGRQPLDCAAPTQTRVEGKEVGRASGRCEHGRPCRIRRNAGSVVGPRLA